MIHILDIETTTDHKNIRLVGVMSFDGGTGTLVSLIDNDTELRETIEGFNEGDALVTFNGEGFDYPVLKKVWGIDVVKMTKGLKLIDLFLLGKLVDNDRHSHSLESWGKEAGASVSKGSVDYNHAPLPELAAYLRDDLVLTKDVFYYMREKVFSLFAKGHAFEHALQVETSVRRLLNKQKDEGFKFDTIGAEVLYDMLSDEIEAREMEAIPFMPSAPIPKSQLKHPPKRQFNMDGKPSANLTKYVSDHGGAIDAEARLCSVGGKLYALPLTEPLRKESTIHISEQGRLKDYCLSKGWLPTMWNTNKSGDKTSPRLVHQETKEPCPNLITILPDRLLELLAEYNTLKSRRSMLKPESGTSSGLINKVDDTGYIHHDADGVGTPTMRFRHKGIVNIPRVSSLYGKEMRSLFLPDPAHVMVGWDASSLEACMEAHYTYPYDPDYAKELVKGDVHQRNLEALDLPDRDAAKKFKYMVTYGARPPKIAGSMGVSLRQAELWYDEFWDANPALAKLMVALDQEWKDNDKKFLNGLDGRVLATRMQHALLNTKLQGAGAVVMKHAMLIADKTIRESGLDARALIRYHDEEQWSAHPFYAERVGELGVESIEKAAKYLRLNVPVTGEYKIGKNWSVTH